MERIGCVCAQVCVCVCACVRESVFESKCVCVYVCMYIFDKEKHGSSERCVCVIQGLCV